MSEIRSVAVPEELDRVRIDRVLAVLAEVSRSASRRMLDEGAVTVAGEPATMATMPHTGQVIQYVDEVVESRLIAEPVEFDIAFDSPDVFVVNKPAGLVVHPGAGNASGTLVNGLIHRFPELEALGEEHRWGLVHRLDRETSGLLLVARSAEMHDHLQAELKARTIGRTYLTLVNGHLQAATGTIDAPIARDPFRMTRMALVQDGRSARTHYRRLAEWDDCSLVEVHLETGRTHQIRVHFSSIGHGLVGDSMYGRGSVDAGDPGRVWLHAAVLRFSLPDGSEQEVSAPLPEDLVASLDDLGDPVSGEIDR
ncbi:MAG: RluA family pseudouridine synthase [bacterium]|nr:RluA family pseudouridine synthase [bacterium]